MTPAAARPVQPWWARPATVLPIVAALAVLAAIFSPARVGPRTGDPRLTTYSASPLGARLLHDLAQRLGWRTERRLLPALESDPGTIHAVLDPAVPLRSTEAHALLAHVRSGGAALVVLGGSTGVLLDSLHLTIGGGGLMAWVERDSAFCAGRELPSALSLWFGFPPQMLSFRWRAPAPEGTVTFLEARRSLARGAGDTLAPTMLGFPLGAGRLVVAADPDVFRNDAMRDCGPGLDVAAVRALEYLRAGGPVPRDRIVFDEYHQAFGAHPGTVAAVLAYLGTSPSGRLLAQLALAGLLLLLALGPRTVPPRDDPRVERRSPLEQVDALARAYAQVGATRTAAQRLVRGVRRRSERGATAARALDDDAWLAGVAARHPALAADVALARRALADPLPAREFPSLGPALHRLEATLTRPS